MRTPLPSLSPPPCHIFPSAGEPRDTVFGRQRMPQRVPKNRLPSHEASEDLILAELWEPKIQWVHPVPRGSRAGALSLVTSRQPSHSACRWRREPKSPEAAFSTCSPGAGEEGQWQGAVVLVGKGCPKLVGAPGCPTPGTRCRIWLAPA